MFILDKTHLFVYINKYIKDKLNLNIKDLLLTQIEKAKICVIIKEATGVNLTAN